ncbi:MAG: AAA family ATPase [Candidatus Aminicenantes bacterium]|nr:AAA family ATPase [Candidatus Aminicenantes bacterium]
MRIKELRLKNFRGFKELQIKFPESKLLVLVGINGAGKSSILDCIAVFLSQFVAKLCKRDPNENDVTITENDINIDEKETIIDITLAYTPDPPAHSAMTAMEWGDDIDTNIIHWTITKSHSSKEPGSTLDMNLCFKDFYKSLQDDPDQDIPVFTYYQNQKIIPGKPSESMATDYELDQFYAYENAFKKGVHDFGDFLTWFRNQEDWENEKKIENWKNEKKIEKVLDFVNNNLEIVRKAIGTFLGNIPSADFLHLRVMRQKKEKPFRFEASRESSLVIDKAGKSLKIEQLSDGEKMLLLVVSDLARRLSIANPRLGDALAGKGIVLIDEVDLHLHPQWQREVIPALLKTFPNCQFIVTTHSPQVLSNVEKENVMILENFQVVEKTPFTYGRDSNSILYELMGVEERPAKVKHELDKLYRLIDDEKLEEARVEIKRLTEMLGENDKEIVRANMYIDFQGA